MKRIHLFELEDLAWFPSFLRGYMLDYLKFMAALSDRPYEAFARELRAAMERLGETKILDLCSGSSGPIRSFLRVMKKNGFHATATLTDLYPNVEAFAHVARGSDGMIDYIAAPVDATAVPAELKGFRLFSNSFHHFPPRIAHQLLEDAVRNGQGIAVFEVAERAAPVVLSILLAPLILWICTPFMRPFRLSRFFFTYIVPLIPLGVVWDGLVSCLRVYSPEELRELTADLSQYQWKFGHLPTGAPGLHVTYLFGTPH